MPNNPAAASRQGRPDGIEAILAEKILKTLKDVSATASGPVPTTPPKLFVLARGLSGFSLKAWQNADGKPIALDPARLAGTAPQTNATYSLDVSGDRLSQPIRFHGVYPVFARANPEVEQVIGLPSPPLARQVDSLIALLSAIESARPLPLATRPKSSSIIVEAKGISVDAEFGAGLPIRYPCAAKFMVGRSASQVEISGDAAALKRLIDLNPSLTVVAADYLGSARPLPQRQPESSTLFVNSPSVTLDQGLPSSLHIPPGTDFMIGRSGANFEISGKLADVLRLVKANEPLLNSGQTRYRLGNPSP